MATEDLFHELTYYTLTRSREEFMHQYVVDAYGAQTASASDKPIRLVFALIGLYLQSSLAVVASRSNASMPSLRSPNPRFRKLVFRRHAARYQLQTCSKLSPDRSAIARLKIGASRSGLRTITIAAP